MTLNHDVLTLLGPHVPRQRWHGDNVGPTEPGLRGEEHAMLGRAGITSVQRLHREAVSEHGDAFQLGARATMRPYGTTVADGWSGNGAGSNYCNTCNCNNGALACTKMGCPPQTCAPRQGLRIFHSSI